MKRLPLLHAVCPTVVWMILLLVATLAVEAVRFDKYEWPLDAEELLRSRLLEHANVAYTEQQADEFLANAMLYHVRESLQSSMTAQRPFERMGVSSLITSATFRPRHVVITEGLEQESPRNRHSPRWFSLPMLVADVRGSNGLSNLHIPLQNGMQVRSLDLIRFDGFKVRNRNGFWLPTAIVRPRYSPMSGRLKFTVVYEYPTSVNKYRASYHISPRLADATLQHDIRRKQGIWLRKLATADRELISRMWANAPGSALLLSSPFLSSAKQTIWKTPAELKGQVSRVLPDLNGEHDVEPTSSGEHDELHHPPRLEAPAESTSTSVMRNPIDGAPSSTANQHNPPPVFEHDFVNAFHHPEQPWNPPFRQQAVHHEYPTQEHAYQFPPYGFASHESHVPEQRPVDLNLGLSLAPSSSDPAH